MSRLTRLRLLNLDGNDLLGEAAQFATLGCVTGRGALKTHLPICVPCHGRVVKRCSSARPCERAQLE